MYPAEGEHFKEKAQRASAENMLGFPRGSSQTEENILMECRGESDLEDPNVSTQFRLILWAQS